MKTDVDEYRGQTVNRGATVTAGFSTQAGAEPEPADRHFAEATASPTNFVALDRTEGFLTKSRGGVANSGQEGCSAPSLRYLGAGNWARTRLILDALSLYVASSVVLLTATTAELRTAGELVLIFPLLALAMLHASRRTEEHLQPSALSDIAHVLGTVTLAVAVLIAIHTTVGNSHPMTVAIPLWCMSLGLLVVGRLALLCLRRGAMRNPAFATPTLVIGGGDVGARVVRLLFADARYGLRPVGILDPDPRGGIETMGPDGVPLLGWPDDLRRCVAETGARQVILAFSSQPDHRLAATIRDCQELGLEISVVPRLFECLNFRASLEHVGTLPLLALRPTNLRGWEFALKHALDRAVAMILLVGTAPLMATIALAVRISSPGPVLFRQRRVGRDSREFDVLKFRTMRDSRSPVSFVPRDGCAPGGVEGQDRRTAIGRFLRESALDELPQLVNVLRGEMSLVGPRPERPEFVNRFSRDISRYNDRHRVKSGMTGWAQVHGLRGQTSIVDRIEFDNYYIENWSLRLDLRILAMTVVEMFCHPREI